MREALIRCYRSLRTINRIRNVDNIVQFTIFIALLEHDNHPLKATKFDVSIELSFEKQSIHRPLDLHFSQLTYQIQKLCFMSFGFYKHLPRTGDNSFNMKKSTHFR